MLSERKQATESAGIKIRNSKNYCNNYEASDFDGLSH